ncbi:MAG TPA: CoA transferase [Candidatus Binataceae bacterium]|nr:CoA transferase [Candidatus Binataceae bacterium]
MPKPLEGIRVIEIAQIYAGPYCGLQLAHFGAEVIKIEPPGEGEFLRMRPPKPRGANSGFLMLNPGKKSVVLNLKDERGREFLMRLLESADVVLENYAAGALEGMGLGYEDVAKRCPRLIYASCKGYGPDSRWANLGAMDFTVQAASGIVDMTGYADRPGVRATAALIDTSAGMHLVAGILAALIERGRTGRGKKVEVAMLDICVPAVNGMIASALNGNPLPRLANRHPSACPSNTYFAADGQILIYCLTEDHWKRFARLIGRADLLDNPRYKDHASRYAIIDEVEALVTEWTRARKRDDMVNLLIEHGIPCAPVRTITEVAHDPELRERGLLRTGEYLAEGSIPVLGSAIKMSGEPEAAVEPPRVPGLGENTAEVLRGLGIDETAIEQLRRDRVI